MSEIAIVIPAYNRADLISETLDSVLSQDYPSWECLIVDDHSTDNTQQICINYTKKDARFKFYLNERSKGAQGARNTGIDKSTSPYLIFLDSDDLLSSDCLSRRMTSVLANPEYDFFCFPTGIFKKKPGDTSFQWNYLNTEDEDLIRFLRQDTPWHTSGVLWKKEALNLLGGWDEKLAAYQDWDIHLRAVLEKKIKYLKIDKGVDTYYRLDDSTATISKAYTSERNINSTIYLIDKFFPLIEIFKIKKESKNAFASFIYYVTAQYYRNINKEKAIFLLNEYLLKLNYSKVFIMSWSFYLEFRRNFVYPKALRKVCDIIPFIYKNDSLISAKSTCKKAIIKI